MVTPFLRWSSSFLRGGHPFWAVVTPFCAVVLMYFYPFLRGTVATATLKKLCFRGRLLYLISDKWAKMNETVDKWALDKFTKKLTSLSLIICYVTKVVVANMKRDESYSASFL